MSNASIITAPVRASLIDRGEKLIGLMNAGRRFPGHRENSHISASTILRWIITGVNGLDGHPVKLEAVRLGTRWLTSVEALTRFSASLTPPIDEPPATIPITAPRLSKAAASRELDVALGKK